MSYAFAFRPVGSPTYRNGAPYHACRECRGSGQHPHYREESCENCGGIGWFRAEVFDPYALPVTELAPNRAWRSNTHRRKIPLRTRREIFHRDGGVCQICDKPVDPEDFHLDHFEMVSLGGDHDPDNLRLAHPACNLGRDRKRV